MTFLKILKFKDVNGKWHKYCAAFVNGELLPKDKRNIDKIKAGKE